MASFLQRVFIAPNVRVMAQADLAEALGAEFQAVMGWTDTHLHEFDIAGCRFAIPDPDWPTDVVSEKRVRLQRPAQRLERIKKRLSATAFLSYKD